MLNKPQFRNPGILVTGNNFGAGSSREAAVWGMLGQQHPGDRGAQLRRHLSRELPAERPAAGGAGAGGSEAFEQRVIAANGAAPFTVDLETQTISGPGGPDITFDIAASDRTRLLEGLDDIGLTLKHTDEIKAFGEAHGGGAAVAAEARDSRAVNISTSCPAAVAAASTAWLGNASQERGWPGQARP